MPMTAIGLLDGDIQAADSSGGGGLPPRSRRRFGRRQMVRVVVLRVQSRARVGGLYGLPISICLFVATLVMR